MGYSLLTVFLAGHLMHWSLDHKAHPFVFNRSGEIAGDTKYWHYRFESMIDTMMVKQIKGYKLSEVKSYEFVDSKPEHRKIIGDFFRKIVLSVYNLDFPTEKLHFFSKETTQNLGYPFELKEGEMTDEIFTFI